MSKDMNNKFLNLLMAMVVGIIVIPLVFGSMFFSFIMKSTENKVIVAVIYPKFNVDDIKEEIKSIPHVKKIFIEYKDEQYNDMYEEMENFGLGTRYKDQIKIKVDKQKNLKKVFEKVSEKEYVEKANYFPDTEVFDGVGKAFKVRN